MKTILITGANRGIGLALTEHFIARGDRVIGVCRRSSPALDATGTQVEPNVDVTDSEALASLAQRLGDTRIDVLVCNAGILASEKLGEIDDAAIESMRRQFEVNTLGPLRVVQALLHLLDTGA